MRSGGCAINQTLNNQAASLVKQAVVLAKRRGHAQVTPLHVANAMLAVSGGPLRAACMQSHSHPLQCKALELCFNVGLNRLPSGPTHSQYPTISNALVAAFKRAQAHQRRGSTESQSQPILAVKIELEQLVVSILDDPSVSRVMREAGFSSTQVKTNVEKVVSLELSKNSKCEESEVVVLETSSSINGDVETLVSTLLSGGKKKRSVVVVGESIMEIESTVKELMDRVDKGGVPEGLKEVKFITIPPFYSFCNLDKELVEQKMGELAYLVKSLVGKGVVLYLGDLNWVSEYRDNLERVRSYYCSVEHMIMEIGKLICEIGEIGRFWVMGIATFQTYIRCKNGYSSLESIWRLNPVTIPANSLELSLISQSCNVEQTGAKDVTLTCCPDCRFKFEIDAKNIQNETTLTSSSSLPPWLKDESRRLCSNNQKNNESSIMELRKKWNTYCNSSSHITLTSPSSYTSFDPHLSLSKPDPNSPSSSNDVVEHTHKFKEFNAVNLNTLCNALQKKVPWQREIIPEIAGTILQCRSGMVRRKVNDIDGCKEDTWLLFLGPDSLAKQKIASYLARVVFGSTSKLVPIGCDCIEKFGDAVYENPNRVFLVDGLEKADYRGQIMIKRAIESGRIVNGSGEEVCLGGAIVVLMCERFGCRSTPERSPGNVAGAGDEEGSPRVMLDLNSSFYDDIISSVEQNQFVDDLGILENVDRVVVFKIPNI